MPRLYTTGFKKQTVAYKKILAYDSARNMEDALVKGQGETPNSKKSGGGFFALFGKLVFALIIISGLLYGGYYLGKNQLVPTQKITLATTSPKTSPTPAPSTSPAASPVASSLPSTASPKTVKAGIASSAFGVYKISIPDGWSSEDTPDVLNKIDVLILTHGEYKITISQGAASAGNCIFPGDTNTGEMGILYDNFVGFTGTSTGDHFKRGTQNGGLTYNICQLVGTTSYRVPTAYGYITYSVPAHADPTLLNQMDGIISSITR